MQQLRSRQEDDRNRAPSFLAIAATLGPIAVVTTCLRLWFRTSKRQLGLDDLFIGISALLLVAETVVIIIDVHAGLGRHQYSLQVDQDEKIMKWAFVMYILSTIIICLVKISISFLMLRLKQYRWLRYFLSGLMVGLVLTNGACLIALIAECQPVRTFWDGKSGTCWDPKILNSVEYVQAVYSILSDFICSLLPVVVIWNAQIGIRLKVAMLGLIALGLLTTATTVGRTLLIQYNQSGDPVWSQVPLDIWMTCEQTLAITAANLALSLGIFRFLKERYHQSRNIILPILRRGALATNDQGNYPEDPSVFSQRSNSYIALDGTFDSKMTDSSISEGAPADLSSDICRASSCGVLVARGTHSKSMV